MSTAWSFKLLSGAIEQESSNCIVSDPNYCLYAMRWHLNPELLNDVSLFQNSISPACCCRSHSIRPSKAILQLLRPYIVRLVLSCLRACGVRHSVTGPFEQLSLPNPFGAASLYIVGFSIRAYSLAKVVLGGRVVQDVIYYTII